MDRRLSAGLEAMARPLLRHLLPSVARTDRVLLPLLRRHRRMVSMAHLRRPHRLPSMVQVAADRPLLLLRLTTTMALAPSMAF